MKNLKIANLWYSEKGAVLTVVVLILIPLLLATFIFIPELKRTYFASDNKLQNAVSLATKDAANMVDPESQAQGNPHIAYEKARNQLIDKLQYNLALNTDMSGKNVSIFKSLKYWVLIYNGDTQYKGYDENNKVVSYAFYTNQNGAEESVIDNSITGFTQTLYISDTGISDTQTVNSVLVTLTEPGVLTVVQGETKQIFTKETKLTTRWAYANITKK